MNKYATQCKACHVAKIWALCSKAKAIVAGGKCPDCSLPLRRNIALTGWYQCAAYGSPAYRAAEFRNAPPCLFQCFTE